MWTSKNRGRALLMAVSLGTALSFVSCEGPPVPHQVTYRDADFAAARGTGSGAVVGQAFATMEDNSVRYLENSSIDLQPVNAYTTEIIERRFARGENLMPSDPRYLRQGRSAPTDATGHFEFHGLPSGEYYVGSSVDWKNWYWNTDGEGVMYKVWVQYAQPVYARVSVKNGQTVRVTDWSYGKERSW
jgi:hypothetical protein